MKVNKIYQCKGLHKTYQWFPNCQLLQAASQKFSPASARPATGYLHPSWRLRSAAGQWISASQERHFSPKSYCLKSAQVPPLHRHQIKRHFMDCGYRNVNSGPTTSPTQSRLFMIAQSTTARLGFLGFRRNARNVLVNQTIWINNIGSTVAIVNTYSGIWCKAPFSFMKPLILLFVLPCCQIPEYRSLNQY